MNSPPTKEQCQVAIQVLEFLVSKQDDETRDKNKNKNTNNRIAKPAYKKIEKLTKQFLHPYLLSKINKVEGKKAAKQEIRAQSGLEQSKRERERKYALLYQSSESENPMIEDQKTKHAIQESTVQHLRLQCYICKQQYSPTIGNFYDQMCDVCNDFNFSKRVQTRDLSGKYALVTGARVKIGFATCLKLLRAGVFVIGVTRFPHDALKRYTAEKDYQEWAHRLHLYQLDLVNIPLLSHFTKHVRETYPALHYLINNACQTIRKPVSDYEDLYKEETRLTHDSLHAFSVKHFPMMDETKNYPLHSQDQETSNIIVSSTEYDEDHQLVEKRLVTSWQLELPDIDTTEFMECQLINVTAPFLLIRDLTPLMKLSSSLGPHDLNYIINVSSMEGRFNRTKTSSHPHLNACKAALNMMTRTSGQSYLEQYHISMLSVDTAWANNYKPLCFQKGWQNPVDAVDGAARILDPIFTKSTLSGYFMKDYKICSW